MKPHTVNSLAPGVKRDFLAHLQHHHPDLLRVLTKGARLVLLNKYQVDGPAITLSELQARYPIVRFTNVHEPGAFGALHWALYLAVGGLNCPTAPLAFDLAESRVRTRQVGREGALIGHALRHSDVLDKFSSRDVAILVQRFPPGGELGATFDSIGQTYGRTRERVRQVIIKMMTAIENEFPETIVVDDVVTIHG